MAKADKPAQRHEAVDAYYHLKETPMGTRDAAHPQDGNQNLEAVHSGRKVKNEPVAGKQPLKDKSPLQDTEQNISHNPLTAKPKSA